MTPALPLAGIQVIEIGGGAAGATVRVTALDQRQWLAGIVRADLPAEQAYAAYLGAGRATAATGAAAP